MREIQKGGGQGLEIKVKFLWKAEGKREFIWLTPM